MVKSFELIRIKQIVNATFGFDSTSKSNQAQYCIKPTYIAFFLIDYSLHRIYYHNDTVCNNFVAYA